MKGTVKVLCKVLLLSAVVAFAHEYEEEGLYEEDVGWERRRHDPVDEDFDVGDHHRSRREVNEEWREETRRPRRSCCRDEYEDYEAPRRSKRALHQYEVHEETGDEPQWTAPLFGPHVDELLAAASAGYNYHVRGPDLDQAPTAEHYHRVQGEPGSPAPARYLAPHSAREETTEEEDQDPEGTFMHHHKQHAGGHKQAAGGGHAHHAGHHVAHDGTTTRGHKSVEHLNKGAKGSEGKELHSKEYEEAEGKKKKHHDEAGHQGHHEEEAHGHKGAKFDEKKGHKKGHKTKGYHNKYHKDEFHKEHKFYDDYHKGGSHHRYGKFHAKHASNEGGRKKAHHVDAAHDAMHKGTKGFSQKGHLDSDHRGHKSKQGHEAHHAHQDAYAKQGGHQGASQYGYHKKN